MRSTRLPCSAATAPLAGAKTLNLVKPPVCLISLSSCAVKLPMLTRTAGVSPANSGHTIATHVFYRPVQGYIFQGCSG